MRFAFSFRCESLPSEDVHALVSSERARGFFDLRAAIIQELEWLVFVASFYILLIFGRSQTCKYSKLIYV